MVLQNHTTIKHILWLLPALWCFTGLQAQTYIADIRKLSVEDGLSNRIVNAIHKDSRGFMWIATEYGLNCYDGYTFKLYTKENSALKANKIREIHEDQEQKLWLTYPIHERSFTWLNRIDILDLQTGNMRSFEAVFKTTAPFTAGDIYHLYSDSRKNIWILTDKNELYRYHNKRFDRVFSSPERFWSILYADNECVWLYGNDFVMIDMEGNVVKRQSSREKGPVNFWGFNRNDNPWIFQLHKKNRIKSVYNVKSQQVIDLKALKLPETMYNFSGFRERIYINDTDHLIWWYGEDAFLVIHPRKGIVLNLYEQIKPLLTYEGLFAVSGMYFDAQNRTWIATSDGIFIVDLKENRFTTLPFEGAKKYNVRGITEDHKGILHINTYDGRILIDPEKKEARVTERSLWLGATRDQEGNLWFANNVITIEKYDPLSGESRYYDYPAGSPDPPAEQWTIFRDKTGRVWTGTNRGLHVLEPETGRRQRFTRYNAFSELEESAVYYLHEDEKGIWIAAALGLYLLEPGKGITARYATDEAIPYRIPYDHILHFYRDTTGIFWLATRGGGLIRFDPRSGSYQQFTSADGLSNNIIYAVYEDDYGKLWLPSDYGLMQFDKKTGRVNTWFKGDGIAHNEFNTGSHYRGSDGRLYFGGLAGVTAFHPKDFTDEDVPVAPLRITACRVLDGKTGDLTDKTPSVSGGKGLTLSPSDRSMTLEFALLNYENTEKNTYTYKIEGLDKEWTTIRENRLRINALPYGRYTLYIKGQGIQSVQAANQLAIAITVNKPFYRKNGFILTVVVVLGMLLYGIFHWRLQRLKNAKIRLQETVKQRTREIQRQKDEIENDKNTIEAQAGKLKALDEVKSRFFANISHELRTPLTLILGPVGNIASALNGKEKVAVKTISNPIAVIQRNGKKLLQLIEEILDLSKLEAHKMEIQESSVAFYPFIKRLFVTFESHAANRNIRYRLAYDLDNDIRLVLDSDKTEKIMTNFLSNAFKYSPDGASISLSVTAEAPFIRIAVHDTGPGIHPDDLPYVFDRFYQSKQAHAPVQGGTGIGLALCKELAALMGGEVHVESEPGKGSIFSYTWQRKEPAKPLAVLPQENDPPEELSVLSEAPHTGKATALAARGEPVTDSTEKYSVLVVEDHQDMRDFIVGILRDHYQIQTAGDGQKAIALLQEKAFLPDLILSDVMMPNMDGFSLLEHIKSHPVWRTLPVVLLTARAAQQDRLQALGIGVDDYLTKPFDATELLARIRNLLINYRERKQWQQTATADTPLPVDFGEKPESWDTKWLAQARDIVKREVANHNYKVSDLSAEMHISKSQLLTKLKQITGLTPHGFIQEIKLQKARVLLENKAKSTMAEVAYAAGFNTPNYFSTLYEKRFGKRPSTYFTDT